jgi:hypothetical protein
MKHLETLGLMKIKSAGRVAPNPVHGEFVNPHIDASARAVL